MHEHRNATRRWQPRAAGDVRRAAYQAVAPAATEAAMRERIRRSVKHGHLWSAGTTPEQLEFGERS